MLVVGGLPRSRLPMLVALFVIAAGLLTVALVQLRRQQELARLRTEFVSGVSHELRTPLAQIRWFAELLHLGKLRTRGRARALGGDHRPGSAAADVPRRERSQLLARREGHESHLAGARRISITRFATRSSCSRRWRALAR